MLDYLKQFKNLFVIGALFFILLDLYVAEHRIVTLKQKNQILKDKMNEIVIQYNAATEKLKAATILQANKIENAEKSAAAQHKVHINQEKKYAYINVPSDCLLSIKWGTLQAVNLAQEWHR